MGKRKNRSDDDTFITITNRDLWNRLEKFEEKFEEKFNNFEKVNETQHKELNDNQSFTNGKVRWNRWLASTTFGMFIFYITGGYIF